MSVVLAIRPFHNALDIYGHPDPSSAYSLSGHVSISVTSPYSLFESRRPARLLLKSLSLTFEGQSEIYTPSTTYSSLRLCSITRELVSGEPIEISNEGHEDLDKPCVWNIVFNLPIPGWLPESSTNGIEDLGVRYALYANAQFSSLDEEHGASSSWSPLAALCAPFRSRLRTAEASRTITLRRFITAPGTDVAEVPRSNYLVNSTPSPNFKGVIGKEKIPPSVLSKIQVFASVADYINVEDQELCMALRLRTKELDDEHCKRLQLTEVSVDIVQNEKFRERPSSAFKAQFPIPPTAMQPPNLPLLDPHPMSFVYDSSFFGHIRDDTVCRNFSLLPRSESGKYKMDANNYIFKDDPKEEVPTWYTINTKLPIDSNTNVRSDSDTVAWAGPPKIRPSSIGPLFGVYHEIAISLTCSYDWDDGSVATDKLSFRIPVTFGKVAPKLPATSRRVTVTGEPSPITAPSLAAATDAPEDSFALPPYSQLYDRNGERKIDYSTPLPLYTPRTSTSSTRESEVVPLLADVDSSMCDLQKEGEKHPLPAMLHHSEFRSGEDAS